jgi:hypothetical protein
MTGAATLATLAPSSASGVGLLGVENGDFARPVGCLIQGNLSRENVMPV